jgi:hypothetical protein
MSGIRPTLREIGYAISPPWLRGPNGAPFLEAFNSVADASLERTYQGVVARFPSQCDDTVLPEHSHDRQMMRGCDESAAAFRLRLRYWRQAHRLRGHAYGILKALGGYLAPHLVRIKIVTDSGVWYERATDGTLTWSKHLGTWDWDDAAAPCWSRFWIIIYPPASLWVIAPADGMPGPWVLTATATQIKDVRRLVYFWKPMRARCEWIVIALDPASFDETGALEPDGDWQLWGVGNAPRAANRLGTARYWRGQEVYGA